MISLLGWVRLEVFTTVAFNDKKIQVQKKTIEFVASLMNFTNTKQILAAVRN